MQRSQPQPLPCNPRASPKPSVYDHTQLCMITHLRRLHIHGEALVELCILLQAAPERAAVHCESHGGVAWRSRGDCEPQLAASAS